MWKFLLLFLTVVYAQETTYLDQAQIIYPIVNIQLHYEAPTLSITWVDQSIRFGGSFQIALFKNLDRGRLDSFTNPAAADVSFCVSQHDKLVQYTDVLALGYYSVSVKKCGSSNCGQCLGTNVFSATEVLINQTNTQPIIPHCAADVCGVFNACRYGQCVIRPPPIRPCGFNYTSINSCNSGYSCRDRLCVPSAYCASHADCELSQECDISTHFCVSRACDIAAQYDADTPVFYLPLTTIQVANETFVDQTGMSSFRTPWTTTLLTTPKMNGSVIGTISSLALPNLALIPRNLYTLELWLLPQTLIPGQLLSMTNTQVTFISPAWVEVTFLQLGITMDVAGVLNFTTYLGKVGHYRKD